MAVSKALPTTVEETLLQRTILTTIGTSLLTNLDRPWFGWRHCEPLPASETVDAWLRHADPVLASAETHTWFRLGLHELIRTDRVEVVLIHSETSEGRFCAERLAAYASAIGIKARGKQVNGLNYSGNVQFNHGLRQLVRVLGDEIKKGQKDGQVEIAATGGFKAEIAIANLVGAISDTLVHYIYQEFSSIVTIEPIPVTLRADWVAAGAGRKLLQEFETGDDVIPSVRIESLLRQDERLKLLIDIDGESAALTLMGQLALRLIESPDEDWPPQTTVPPNRKKRLDSAAHHRPRGWEQVVDKLANSAYVTSIRHEGSISGGCLREAVDNESDLIHRIEGSPPLTLRISTTADNAAQRQRIQRLLKEALRQ